MRDGELVDKRYARPRESLIRSPNSLSDIAPFVTQDGKEITSRSGLRAYDQANGDKQVGNDFASQTAELRRKVYGEQR